MLKILLQYECRVKLKLVHTYLSGNKLFLFVAFIFINVAFTSYDQKHTKNRSALKEEEPTLKQISIMDTATLRSGYFRYVEVPFQLLGPLSVTSRLSEGTVKPIAIVPPITSPTTATITTSTGTLLTIDCSRNTIGNAKSPSEFLVEVTIKKDNVAGFTKFIETLPVGFSATVIESQGATATVSFVDQKIIFVWNTLPSQSEFKVSYKINVAPNISGEKIIEGVFSFIENDQIMKFVLPQTSINIIAPVIEHPIAAAHKPKIPIVAPKPPTVDYYHINKPKGKKGAKKLAAGNINYKVQFLALYQPDPNVQVPLVLDSINELVETTMTQGFLQYTIGPFNAFDEAVKHKEKMVLNGYPGSFIKAYMHKQRITIKEARAIQEVK